MKIGLTSVMVDDQEKALRFYTEKLGFVTKTDMPAGEGRWLTVVSPEGAEGVELLLEPMGIPEAKAYQKVLYNSGITAAAFFTDDIDKEYEKLRDRGVVFTVEPTKTEWGAYAVFEDTCGNLISLTQT